MTFDLEKAREVSAFMQAHHHYGGDRFAEALAEIEQLQVRMLGLEGNHCIDCCCARSWKALGIETYTGKSIPEEIEKLQQRVIENRDAATDLQYQLDDAMKENEQQAARIKELEDALTATEALFFDAIGQIAWSIAVESGRMPDQMGVDFLLWEVPPEIKKTWTDWAKKEFGKIGPEAGVRKWP